MWIPQVWNRKAIRTGHPASGPSPVAHLWWTGGFTPPASAPSAGAQDRVTPACVGARPSPLSPEPGGGPHLPDTSRTEARTARPVGSPEGGARSLPPSRHGTVGRRRRSSHWTPTLLVGSTVAPSAPIGAESTQRLGAGSYSEPEPGDWDPHRTFLPAPPLHDCRGGGQAPVHPLLAALLAVARSGSDPCPRRSGPSPTGSGTNRSR